MSGLPVRQGVLTSLQYQIMALSKYDAIVVGSGMGGMCAAARLTARGFKVLVAEKSRYLGGRCSHRVRRDCIVTTGAIMIPMGPNSAIREAFDVVGAEMDMVDITGRMRYRLAHGDYDVPPGGGGLYGMIEFAMQNPTTAQQLFQHIRDALLGWMPLNDISILEWFDQYTDNREVKNLFQGYCASLMGTNLHEIPAGEFFRFLKDSSKGTRFGLAANGNGRLMEALAEAIRKHGSDIRCNYSCKQIDIENNKVTGITVSNAENQEERILADCVISNCGPDRTVELAGGDSLFEKSYITRLRSHDVEAPIYHVSFVMDEPLIKDFDGCLVFGNTKNLIYLESPSVISPALAPSGKYLHTAYGAPTDASNPNLKGELKTVLDELEENFPGMSEKADFLVKAKHHGRSPGMHRWVGYSMPVDTPVRGLYNVGDGCALPGTIGTEGSAASAREVTAKICGDA